MKKLLVKDKKLRSIIEKNEKTCLILISIFRNLNFSSLVRWNAFLKLKKIKTQYSEVSISNRCLTTINKKRFNSLTKFSRNIFLKLIRSGKIYGFKRSNW